MFLIVSLHSCFEVGEGVVDFFVDGNVDFSGSGPEYNDAVDAGFLLEVADVFADLLGHVPAVFHGLYVVAVEASGVVVVESGFEGHDFFEFVFYGEDVFFFEHLGVHGRFKSVGGINVPSGEYDVVEVGQGHDVLILEVFFVFALSDADFVVLGHGADRFGQTFAGHKYTGNESG